MNASRMRLAELTSSTGALVLGFGLGLMSAKYLGTRGVPIIMIGIVMHAWGMYDKSRLERRVGLDRPTWSKVLYWLCWISLIVLIPALFIWRR